MNTLPPTVAPMSTQPPTDAAAGTQTPGRHHAFNSTLQLLAPCPLLAVSDTVVKAVGFSVIVLVLLPLATFLFDIVRRWLDDTLILPASLLITAGLVTAPNFSLHAS